jgi:glyoxylase-like metal-dependent hydrolase (beta-lactamase superfamily II)
MRVLTIPNGQFVENCYLVIDDVTRQCAIIDPGEDVERISRELTAADVAPAAIWITHAHIDHVLGVPDLRARTGVPVYLHPADSRLYEAVPEQAAWFGLRAAPLPAPDRSFAHGEPVRVGTLEFQVRHTPGHSPGHIVLVNDGAVFGGDVLFRGSIGRTDLPGGSFETLMASIERELLTLPDSTIVYPGHGPDTTIGHERATNPFLTGVSRLG